MKKTKQNANWLDDLRFLIAKNPPTEDATLALRFYRELIAFSELPKVLDALAPLNQSDVYSLLFGMVPQEIVLASNAPAQVVGGFEDKIVKSVQSLFSQYPADYHLDLPLQLFPALHEKEYQLTDSISLVSQTQQHKQHGQMFTLAQGFPMPTLRVKCKGYLDGKSNSSAAISGLSKVREFLYICDLYQFIVPARYGILVGVTVPAVTLDIEWESVGLKPAMGGTISNSTLMGYIKTRRPNDDQNGLLDPIVLNPEETYLRLTNQTAVLRPFFDAATDDLNLRGIRAAIEWAFASETADEASMAFIQAFFSLEALLGANPVMRNGEERGKAPGTMGDRLADRYAYLVGTTRVDRETHESQFRTLYYKRGEIVHGKTTKSSLEHLDSDARIAQKMARRAIKAELDRFLGNLSNPSLLLAAALEQYP